MLVRFVRVIRVFVCPVCPVCPLCPLCVPASPKSFLPVYVPAPPHPPVSLNRYVSSSVSESFTVDLIRHQASSRNAAHSPLPRSGGDY